MKVSKWVKVALFNFLIAALMGLILRAAFLWKIEGLNYRHLLHGHSHIAMLGWVFMALYALFVVSFVPKEKQESRYYNILFYLTQFSVLGMMIAFPIQGYAAVSIAFSTLNVFLSYFFAVRIWKDSKTNKTAATYLMRTSLLGMLMSTIGLWGMAIVMALKYNDTIWYELVIQFYLHFQFNAWFILAVIAVLLQYLINKTKIAIPIKITKRFTVLYFISVFLTYFLVVFYSTKANYSYVLNSIGVVLQLFSIVYLLYFLIENKVFRHQIMAKKWGILIKVGLFSWFIKGFIQLLLVFPQIRDVSTHFTNFMIGYIHLINLGIVSALLFYLLKKMLARFNLGFEIYIFLFGIVMTEVYLFLQGIYYWRAWGSLPSYDMSLLILSIPLPLGVLIVFLRTIFQKKTKEITEVN